jgi:hypothetical protein
VALSSVGGLIWNYNVEARETRELAPIKILEKSRCPAAAGFFKTFVLLRVIRGHFKSDQLMTADRRK